MPSLKKIAKAVSKHRKSRQKKAKASNSSASGHQAMNRGNIINLDLGKAMQKQAPNYTPPIGGNALAAAPVSFMSQLQNLEQMSAARAAQLISHAVPRAAANPVGVAALATPAAPTPVPNALLAASASAAAAAASLPGHATPPVVESGNSDGLETGDPLASFSSASASILGGGVAAAQPSDVPEEPEAIGAAVPASSLFDLAPPLGQGSDIDTLLLQLDNSVLTDITTIRQLAASLGVPQRSESGKAYNGNILRSKILKMRSLYESGELDPVFS